MLDLPNTKTRAAKVGSLPRCFNDFGMRGSRISWLSASVD
jgi:hypothetical protein